MANRGRRATKTRRPNRAEQPGPGQDPGPRAGRSSSGRVTPKAKPAKVQAPTTSGRYTPPIPRRKRSSPGWVPVLMLGLLIVGVLLIIVNYLKVLPGGASDWYLLGGLLLICGGFAVATQYR